MQFDVYENTDKESKKVYPFFVDIQTNLLDTLNSRAVIPLTPIKNVSKEYPKNLCPTITIDNKAWLEEDLQRWQAGKTPASQPRLSIE